MNHVVWLVFQGYGFHEFLTETWETQMHKPNHSNLYFGKFSGLYRGYHNSNHFIHPAFKSWFHGDLFFCSFWIYIYNYSNLYYRFL